MLCDTKLNLLSDRTEEPLRYHLRGIIVHKGEASHGHYYSFMNKPGVGWFRIDDERVTSTKVHVLTRSRSLVQKYKY